MEPKELATRSGLSASYIRVLLSSADRRPSIASAEAIADALCVWLLGWDIGWRDSAPVALVAIGAVIGWWMRGEWERG